MAVRTEAFQFVEAAKVGVVSKALSETSTTDAEEEGQNLIAEEQLLEESRHGEEAMRWYSQVFAAGARRFTVPQKPGTTQAEEPVATQASAELVQALGLEAVAAPPPQGADESSNKLMATFGFPAVVSGKPCYARFDVRDKTLRRVCGFKHGQVVRDSGAVDCELVVVGVKRDRETKEELLWVQPQDLSKLGAFAFKTSDLCRLRKVYKEGSYSRLKYAELPMFSLTDFEAAEDSDGEEVMLCQRCFLPVGTKLYSDEAGNPLHAECMAQVLQCKMKDEELQVQKKDAAKKRERRDKYAIGWSVESIPRNVGPATKLALNPVPRGMCCLMLKECHEGHKACVTPTVNPASCINLEYLSIALKVRAVEGREPTFSLDPVEYGASPEHLQVKNFEPTWLKGTSAGDVLFQSDYHLKELSMGEQEQPVVGMKSSFDCCAWEQSDKQWCAREWFVVRKAEIHMSEDDVVIPHLKMGVEAREQVLGAGGMVDKAITSPDHPMVQYAQQFTDNFDLIAERKSVVYHLRELAKASLLAKFLVEDKVSLNKAWFDLAGEASPECCMEIPQLWNERPSAQIQVVEGKIVDSQRAPAHKRHGLYGGVAFGLDKFKVKGALAARAAGVRAVPAAARAAPSFGVEGVRSVGMLLASMQAGKPPPAAPAAPVPGVPAAAAAPGAVGAPVAGMMPGRVAPITPVGPAPTPKLFVPGVMSGLPGIRAGLEDPSAAMRVPTLQGVDLNLDKFDLEPVRVESKAPLGSWGAAGAAVADAFWSSLGSFDDSMFQAEDMSLLKEIFNPNLSDRREEGDRFTPPDPSHPYVEQLRGLVKRESLVRQRRKEHFFSTKFVVEEPGPIFPTSWHPMCEVTNGRTSAMKTEGNLQPRPDYTAQAAMFDHILESMTPTFDKTTEEGLRFRIYKFGSLDVRTTQEHDGKEVVGAIFSIRSSKRVSTSLQCIQAHEDIVKVTEYVEAAKHSKDAAYRGSYIVLETEQGNMIVTEKLVDGTVTWEENPEDLDDRNSLAKFVRSCCCIQRNKTNVTVGDVEAMKNTDGPKYPSSHSGCKRYAQGTYNAACGFSDRLDSGFGNRQGWNKGKEAKNSQKELRKAKRVEQRTTKTA